MKKLLFIASAAAFFAISCSKDQSAVRKLDGTWTAVEQTVGGKTTDLSNTNIKVTFDKCKVKNEDCSGSNDWDGTVTSFTYSVSDKGEKLTYKTDNGIGGTIETVVTIKELTKDKLITEDKDGDTFTYEQ